MTSRVVVDHRWRLSWLARMGLLLVLVQFLAACSGYSGKRVLPESEVHAPLHAPLHAPSSSPPDAPVGAGRQAAEVTGTVERLQGSPMPGDGNGDSTAEPSMILKTFNSQDPYLPAQVDFINGLLRFAQTVTVLSEVEDGPLFDPGTQEIWMPGSFADVIESHFGEDDAPVADVYLHTLVHEVGHVLYDQYDLPLLAREEDAADALASVLLLEYAQDGARVVLNAARMFGLESETSGQVDEPDFWSEHSLDIQRYYTTLCHVYGSDPEGQARLVNEDYGLSPDRAENCELEYKRIKLAWLIVLKPYLKR